MSFPDEHRFQVSLDGLIDLLAKHLYETPAVFVRELLQNAVDATDARKALDPSLRAEVRVELHGNETGSSTLAFGDNGIGLTESQVHDFLATIGRSAKRGALPERDGGYLGQFGVGLLSCFVVAEEVVVITRSFEEGQPALEWVGRSDGSYSVRRLEAKLPVGTTAFLKLRDESSAAYDRDVLRGLLRHYGDFLTVPIIWVDGDSEERLNAGVAPWRAGGDGEAKAARVREFANAQFGINPIDSFPIRSKSGGVRGLAYVTPHKVNLTAEPNHRVYLKGMLLSDSVSNLLPRWAVFLRCVVDTDRLRPMASREGLHHDKLLDLAREELAQSIRSTIVRTAESDPARLERWIVVHRDAMKALACSDDELYQIILPYLSFLTNRGTMSLVAILDEGKEIAFAPTVDAFRQVAGLASAVDALVVNAGYGHDAELLERVDLYRHEVMAREVGVADFAAAFTPPEDTARAARLADLGERALDAFGCGIRVEGFQPHQVPALYIIDSDGLREADIQRAQEESDELFGSLLGSLPSAPTSGGPTLYLNASSSLIHGLAGAPPSAAETAVRVLYVHALLQAQQPLGRREREILEHGLLELIAMGLTSAPEGGNQS